MFSHGLNQTVTMLVTLGKGQQNLEVNGFERKMIDVSSAHGGRYGCFNHSGLAGPKFREGNHLCFVDWLFMI
jgi:hypothetical protein